MGNESWAGVEDHMSYVRVNGLTFTGEGMRATIISNRTNQTATSPDTEPFSFTNCNKVTIRDLTVESCGVAKSTTDAIDFDQGKDCLIERVRITRSRSRGIVFDGGDEGKHATGNIVRDCILEGRPPRPMVDLVSGGLIFTAGDIIRYCVTYRDSDLGGAGVAAECKPSDYSYVVADSSNKKAKVYLPIGPYSTTARCVYRKVNNNSWELVQTISDNTTSNWTDDGTAIATTASFTDRSMIVDAGIELLAASNNLITGNSIEGIGDGTSGSNTYGVNVVRKNHTENDSSVAGNSNNNQIMANRIRATQKDGVRIFGGSDNQIGANQISNPGVTGTAAAGVRIDGSASPVTAQNRNSIFNNRILSDQDTHNALAANMKYGVTITSTASPTDTVIGGNVVTGYTAAYASDSGTGTEIDAGERTVLLFVDGTLTTTTKAKNFNFAAPWPDKIKRVRLYANTAPTGQAIITDINLNGSTIWSTQGNRAQIAASSNSGTSTTFGTTSFAQGDVFTFDIDQIGSGTAGADLSIELTVLANRVY